MAVDDVHEVVEGLLRVVLAQDRQLVVGRLGVALVEEEVAERERELVVHDRVERVAREELRAILPDLTQEQRLRAVLRLDGLDFLANVGPESRRHLLGNVEAPAVEALVEPLHDDALVLAIAVEQVVTEVRLHRALLRARIIGILERHEAVVALPVVVGVLLAHHVLCLLVADVEPVLPMPRAEYLAFGLEFFLGLDLGRRLRHVLVVHEVVDAAPVLVGTDRLVLAVAIKVDGIIADVVVDTVHDQVHAALLHLRRELLEILEVAEERVNCAVVDGIVAVIRAGIVDRVDVDGRHAEALEVVELLRDAGDIAAEEVVALPLVAVGSRRLAVVSRQVAPFAVLHRLEAARIRTRVVVALVAVEEAVREDLVADGILRPVRRLVVLTVDRELVRLDAAQLELARAAWLRIVAVLLRVVEHELVAVEAVRRRRERGRPDVLVARGRGFRHRIRSDRAGRVVRIVLIATIGRNLGLVDDELRARDIALARGERELYRRALLDGFKRHAVIRTPAVVVDLVLADAAIVGDQALCLTVVVERDIAILGDIDLLRQRILARHLDRDRVVALLERDGLLEEIVEHLVAHQRVIDRAKAA